MRIRDIAFLFVSLLSSSLALAGGWAPIPSEVWAMKEDPAKGIQGAVVLEDRMSFRNTYIEYLIRIRILSEAGRSAAELSEFPSEAYGFQGRTVYPDGREVVFNKRKDFQQRTTKVGSSETERTVVIPPGVTADCVVELRWLESAEDRHSPLPKRMGRSHEWRLGNRFMTQESAIEVPLSFPWAYVLIPSRNLKPTVEEKSSKKIFTFHNIPAREDIPYSLEVTQEVPRFVAYELPELVRRFTKDGPEAFWKQSVNAYWKEIFVDGVRKGSAYEVLSADLRGSLPSDPVAKAGTLLARLDGRIKNTAFPTHAETSQMTKAQAKREAEMDSTDLDALVKLGKADVYGMTLLYIQLLRDAGIEPKIALVADRDQRLFRWDFMNLYQFDAYLIGVERADKSVAWFEPDLRFAVPGLVHPDYQGAPALQIDTHDWSVKRITLMAQGADFNQRRYQVKLSLEDDADRFALSSSFSGYPEWTERRRFMELEPKEQERKLKESIEKDLKGAQVTKVEVRGAQDPKVNLTWSAEGVIEREPGRKREVHPFPGVPWAMWVPDQWPSTRKDAIVIPYLRHQVATCEFSIPKGYAWGEYEPFEHSNRFGHVKWSAARLEGDLVRVTLDITASSFYEMPGTYAEFREFMGWVNEASGRYLTLSAER